MKKFIWYIIIFTLIFTLVACTGDNDPDIDQNGAPIQEENDQTNNDKNDDANVKDEDEKPADETDDELDPQIDETIEIEGMEEKITLNLYDASIVNFRTYIPSDFIAEEASSGEGDGFWFYANYENQKSDDVYLHFYFLSEHINKEPNIDDEDSTFATMVQGMEAVEAEDKYHDWAIKEFKSPDSPKYAALGQHESRYFIMTLNYPVEYAEGFVPRANKVIEHFYWTDTQEYLSK